MKNYWSLKLNRLFAVSVFLFYLIPSAAAQFSEPESKSVRPSQYIFPIKPGQPGSLAGTMGELRNSHFHSGIDIRTNNEIGWPVVAAKGGYISRAGVSGSGFGNVLYITHPDGNTTVYGHLDKFKGAVADYILKERYRRKTSAIDLYFRHTQFVVRQGDTIAFAGNTGSSGGPHLHFDIRKNNMALDPLKFGFSEVRDVAPPIVQKIAFKTLDINSRINDQFGRFEFYASRSGSNYLLSAPILAYGNIGIELLGYDQVDNARYRCGINYIELFVDDKKVFHQQIEAVNLSESRGIFTVMDFKALRNQGNRFYKLYIDDGNKLKFYGQSPGNGQLKINPEKTSDVKVLVSDVFGNTSQVTFKLKPSAPVKEVVFLEPAKKPVAYDIQENTLSIATQPCPDNKAVVYVKGIRAQEVEPDYFNASKNVYLFDLRKLIPDSIIVCNQTLIPNIRLSIPSGIEYKFYSNYADVRFPRDALFDTLYFNTNYQHNPDNTEVFTLGNPLVPLNRSISVTLKPTLPYSEQKNTAVYRIVGKGYSYEGGHWVHGNLQFSTREFGNFTILTDSIAPSIAVLSISNQSVRFRIRDNLSGIATFEATINGKWLLMNYDSKTNIITSERLTNEPLRGVLELIVTDNAGNKKIFTHKIP
jgi:hypothetical protein